MSTDVDVGSALIWEKTYSFKLCLWTLTIIYFSWIQAYSELHLKSQKVARHSTMTAMVKNMAKNPLSPVVTRKAQNQAEACTIKHEQLHGHKTDGWMHEHPSTWQEHKAINYPPNAFGQFQATPLSKNYSQEGNTHHIFLWDRNTSACLHLTRF